LSYSKIKIDSFPSLIIPNGGTFSSITYKEFSKNLDKLSGENSIK
jgi:hypothetical protein